MTFALENGYTPRAFNEIIAEIRDQINSLFSTSYTEASFIGSNWYKFSYAITQEIQRNEVQASEIFLKLQEYIAQTNLKIQRPSVSFPGIVDSFAANSYIASVKKPVDGDAGKIFVCVDTDSAAEEYATTKLAICTLLSQFIVAGLVTQGTETEAITLSNGQSFDFKYSLPNYIPVLLRLTIISSENTLLSIPNNEEIRQMVFDNIAARYRLGWNFEPQKYITLSETPYAASVSLQWSDDAGVTYESGIFPAVFDDLFTFGLEDIEVLIDP